MAIKATIHKNESGQVYPCMKCYHNRPDYIVLFTRRKAGVVLGGDLRNLGEYYEDFAEDQFVAYHGSITLSSL